MNGEAKQDNKTVSSFSHKINQDSINSGRTTISNPTEERNNKNESTAESKRVNFAHFSSVYQKYKTLLVNLLFPYSLACIFIIL